MKNYLLLILLGSILNSCTTQKAEESIFLIPKGFQGDVLVIYDVENSTEKEYSDGKRVYRIPNNGILETEFLENYGVSKEPSFYYVDSLNNREKLEYVIFRDKRNDKDINPSQILVSNLEVGVGTKNFLSFIVGKYADDSIGSRRHWKRMNYFEKYKSEE